MFAWLLTVTATISIDKLAWIYRLSMECDDGRSCLGYFWWIWRLISDLRDDFHIILDNIGSWVLRMALGRRVCR